MNGRLLPRLALGAAVAFALGACRSGPEPVRRVFLITVDTLRADHLGSYGYPRATSPYLDRLARESVVFDWAVAQWPKTGPSFASMFTGVYPHTSGLTHHADVRIPEEYLTLPVFLRERGFSTVAVNSNWVLNPDLGWDRGFDEYLETRTAFPLAAEGQRAYRDSMNARRVNALALPLLERHRGAERLFAWIHYCDPHAPYLLPEGFANPFLDDPHYSGDREVVFVSGEDSAIEGRTDLKYYVAQYDANVLVVDRAIEELVGHLERLGLLEEALVVFTADHGESLGEHDYFMGHGRLPYNTTARVPLYLWRGGRRPRLGTRVTRPVELVDLYPTVRDLAAPGAAVPGLEGRSLAGFLRGAPPPPETLRYAFAAAGGGGPLTHFRTVQDERWKMVYHPVLPTRHGERPEVWELYDLESDPLEARDLAAARPEELRRLRPVLREWMGDRTWIRPPRGFVQQRSAETVKALRALGYIP